MKGGSEASEGMGPEVDSAASPKEGSGTKQSPWDWKPVEMSSEDLARQQCFGEWRPPPSGLYDPTREQDACGVGFVAAIDGTASHRILQDSRTMLLRMEHRGACSCDNDSGDGAGTMTAIPHQLYADSLAKAEPPVQLPPPGQYATGLIFLKEETYKQAKECLRDMVESLGMKLIAWRYVPTNSDAIGSVARRNEPIIRQVFIAPKDADNPDEFEKDLFLLRKSATHIIPRQGNRPLHLLHLHQDRHLQGTIHTATALQLLWRPTK